MHCGSADSHKFLSPNITRHVHVMCWVTLYLARCVSASTICPHPPPRPLLTTIHPHPPRIHPCQRPALAPPGVSFIFFSFSFYSSASNRVQPPSAFNHPPRPIPSASNTIRVHTIRIQYHPRQRPTPPSKVSFFFFFFFLSTHPRPTPSAHYIHPRQRPAPPQVSFFFSFLLSLHSFASTIHGQHHHVYHHRCVHSRWATSARNVSVTHLTHPHGR